MIRSAGRTQSAVAAATGRKSSPYANSEEPNSSQSIPPTSTIAAHANSPPPSPVSRGRGSRRTGAGRGGRDVRGRRAGRFVPYRSPLLYCSTLYGSTAPN
ncbi:hypothetical protein GCM10010347_15330 [Streptomyces cirratus]|uniref:Uncharacterized protein n=1 Tax=Streptomyces cirratus TaxID=68187 RepID=A0ABQ3EM90_9ACTN|nr:hypothetical protein GCM10010347_15330 [Streptomyces cirratus]